MPEESVLEHTITPKSILRHRPIGKRPTVVPIVVQRTSRPSSPEPAHDASKGKRLTQTRKGQHISQTQLPLSVTQKAERGSGLASVPRRLLKPWTSKPWPVFHAHPLVFLGLGMLLMLTLWFIFSTVWGWGATLSDDLRFGRPRTYQVDAWVGHNEQQTGLPSHFIVVNLNRRIEIIEIAGSDPAHTRIYSGPQLYGARDELLPATVSFVTPRGKQYPNMVLLVGGSRVVYLNIHGTFTLQ